ncbi:MAG: metallophosphoesterase, partial [Deltaproteobacteria bacterium]|nr:metallophosphoesterase [Deltaproteobacteria bacterium]
MSRLILFFVVVTAIWIGAHLYMARRMTATLEGTRRRRARALWAVVASFGVLAMGPGRVWGAEWWFKPIVDVGFFSMGVFAILFTLLVGRDLVLALTRLTRRLSAKRAEPVDQGRRRALLSGGNAMILGVTGVWTGRGAWEASREPQVFEVEVPIRGLPEALRGYRIAQLSDLHVGAALDGDDLLAAVRTVQGLSADLIAVTGDLIDGTVEDLTAQVASLGELSAPDGVYFVTGNHEYYWDGPAWCEHVSSLGLEVLINSHRVVERDGARILVAGCTDYRAASFVPEHRSDPAAARAGAPRVDLSILLAHQPKSAFAAAEAGYDLQLSGHTHGGQFFPGTLLVGLVQPFVKGLHQLGAMHVYVNRGTGYWGPPLRDIVREITLLSLV